MSGIVYIIDDEAGTRRALTRVLGAEGFDVRACASAEDFLATYAEEANACLILEVVLPELDGFDLQQQLKDDGIPIPIVFLTGNGDISMSVRAMKAGAVDFLTKPVNDPDLLRAIREALELAAIRRDEHAATRELASRHATLTPREREVMVHVVAGKPNKVIAAELGTGEQNIKIHRSRVMEKMAADSLAHLVRAAQRIGVGE